MDLRTLLSRALALPATIGSPVASSAQSTQGDELRGLGGTWLFVEDRTEGRAVEQGGAPMSVRFALRVEKDAVIYPRLILTPPQRKSPKSTHRRNMRLRFSCLVDPHRFQ